MEKDLLTSNSLGKEQQIPMHRALQIVSELYEEVTSNQIECKRSEVHELKIMLMKRMTIRFVKNDLCLNVAPITYDRLIDLYIDAVEHLHFQYVFIFN